MISLSGVVSIVVYLLIAGAVFGLLFFLIDYVAGQFPSMAPFASVAKIILVILMVLVLIGFLLSLISERPLFRAEGMPCTNPATIAAVVSPRR